MNLDQNTAISHRKRAITAPYTSPRGGRKKGDMLENLPGHIQPKKYHLKVELSFVYSIKYL